MRYEFKETGQTKRLLLVYYLDELKYDISNAAFAQGDVARVHDKYGHDILGDKGENYMHQFKDVCEDGNFDRVIKQIRIALADIEQLLYGYTATLLPPNGYQLENPQPNTGEILLELHVPMAFSASTADLLMKLIEEYVIDYVLEDWASLTYPEGQQAWLIKKQDTASKIAHAKAFTGEIRKVKPSII